MSTKPDEVVTEPAVTEEAPGTEAEADAAFEAAVASVRGEEPATKAPAVSSEPAASSEPTASKEPVKPATEAKPVPTATPVEEALPGIGLTPTQLREKLAKAGQIDSISKKIDKIFGTLGDLQVKAKQQGKPAIEEQVKTFKRITEEYPELAALLTEDMNEAMKVALENFKSPDIDGVVNQRVAEKMGEVMESFQTELVAMKHEDWQEQVASPDFALWLQTLPAKERETVVGSPKAAVVIKAVTDFKTWKDTKLAKEQRGETNQKRLESAITPKSAGVEKPVSQTEDEAFEAGYHSVRGKR